LETDHDDHHNEQIILHKNKRITKLATKSKIIYLSGIANWAHRLFDFDEYRGKKFWSLSLLPDPASVNIIKKHMPSKKLKVNKDDGTVSVTLRRNVDKPWKLKPGEDPEFTPPVIIDKDGNEWNDRGIIGNGSEVTVKLEVYQTPNGEGSRIESVRVDDWVKYGVEDGPEPDEDRNTSMPF